MAIEESTNLLKDYSESSSFLNSSLNYLLSKKLLCCKMGTAIFGVLRIDLLCADAPLAASIRERRVKFFISFSRSPTPPGKGCSTRQVGQVRRPGVTC